MLRHLYLVLVPFDGRVQGAEIDVGWDQTRLEYGADFAQRGEEGCYFEVSMNSLVFGLEQRQPTHPIFPLTLPIRKIPSRLKCSPTQLASVGSPCAVPVA